MISGEAAVKGRAEKHGATLVSLVERSLQVDETAVAEECAAPYRLW